MEIGTKRIQIFEELKDDPWFSKLWKRLKNDDLEIARDFLHLSIGIDIEGFEPAMNRRFLDQEKPKHFLEILELLMISNTKTKQWDKDRKE